MMLRADAPAFVPSVVTVVKQPFSLLLESPPAVSSTRETQNDCHQTKNRHRRKQQSSSRRLRNTQTNAWSNHHSQQEKETLKAGELSNTVTIGLNDYSIKSNGRSQQGKRRGRRVEKKKKNDKINRDNTANQEHNKAPVVQAVVAFPPLVEKSRQAIAQIQDSQWALVVERALLLELEQVETKRREEELGRVDLLSRVGSVCLTPLVRPSAAAAASSTDHDKSATASTTTTFGDESSLQTINQCTTQTSSATPLRKSISRDITRLRDRWWDLLREKRFLDSQQQALICQEQQQQQDLSPCSGSCSSWNEEPVETASIYKQQETKTEELDSQSLDSLLQTAHPLHCAVLHNNNKSVRLLLEMDDSSSWSESFVKVDLLGIADSINLDSNDTLSPLQLAVYLDKPELVKILCETCSPCTVSGAQGRTVLMMAAELGLENCCKTLLACDASLLDRDGTNGDTAIHYACRAAGSPSSALRTLLLSSSNRNNLIKVLSCKNHKGQTPLHVACEHGQIHAVETFLSNCTSSILAKLLNIRDDQNQTPLLTAVRAKSADIVMSLLMWRGNHLVGKKTSVTKASDTDNCPLCCAASAGSIEIVLLLLEFVDQPDGESKYNLNAALHAAERSTEEARFEIMRVLVEAGANPCAPSSNEFHGPCTAISIACAKGDVSGLIVMLESFQKHTLRKRLARRQHPKLRRQPESYFELMEARETVERNLAVTDALVQSLFLSLFGERSARHVSSALCLLHVGAKLKRVDYLTLKAAIEAKRLLLPNEVPVDDEGALLYASTYGHYFMSPVSTPTGSLGSYDRSPLQFWSIVMCSLPWMLENEDVQCSWIMVHGNEIDNCHEYDEDILKDRVVLVAKDEEFVVDPVLVSLKSEKLAAAIRFASMNQASEEMKKEIQLEISALQCTWLLQHIYHGSIVSGWDTDPVQCACDLMELAVVAEEYLCPSLLRECEMRLLSAYPFQCYCWSCCGDVRRAQIQSEDESIPSADCLYSVRGPSRLLNAESSLYALAVAQQQWSMDATTYDAVKCWSPVRCSNHSYKSARPLLDDYEANYWSNRVERVAYVRDAAIETILRNFVAVSKSDAFLSQVYSVIGESESREVPMSSQTRQAQVILLQTCLELLSSSSLPVQSATQPWAPRSSTQGTTSNDTKL